jgi:hypothetical protein
MKTLTRDDSGVNITLEYIFSLMIMVILFSMMVLTIGNIQTNSDRIVLKEEFDIISNDLANRISAFSNEVYLSNQTGTNRQVIVNNNIVYFDLPELVQGKQYNVSITYNDTAIPYSGTVRVTYMSNVNVYSTATFYSHIPVNNSSFYSQQGKYYIFFEKASGQIKVRNNA